MTELDPKKHKTKRSHRRKPTRNLSSNNQRQSPTRSIVTVERRTSKGLRTVVGVASEYIPVKEFEVLKRLEGLLYTPTLLRGIQHPLKKRDVVEIYIKPWAEHTLKDFIRNASSMLWITNFEDLTKWSANYILSAAYAVYRFKAVKYPLSTTT